MRALARDYVDSRWMISNLLGLIVLLLLLSYMIKWIGLVVYAMLAIVLVEWMLSARRVLAMAAERGLDPGRDRMTTLGLYMGTRAYLPRRWRLPKARVARGAEI